jgi:hypothetical protein
MRCIDIFFHNPEFIHPADAHSALGQISIRHPVKIKGGWMSTCRAKSGKERLLEYHRKLFRIPENLNHYSPEDYELAERKFLKCLVLGHGSGEGKKPSRKTG